MWVVEYVKSNCKYSGNIQFLLIVNETEIRTLTYKNTISSLVDENDEELNEWDITKNSIKDLSEYEIENNKEKQTYIKIKLSSIIKIYTIFRKNRHLDLLYFFSYYINADILERVV